MATSPLESKENSQLGKIPTGYRFCPTDEELIDFYLRRKILSQPLPVTSIPDIAWKDFHREPPANLVTSSSNEDREWFFFIHCDKNLSDTSTRTVGDGLGFWKKANTEEIPIPIRADSNLRGTKNYLTYYTGREALRARKTHWEMEEYSLHFQSSPNQNPKREAEWVLARIKRGGYYKN